MTKRKINILFAFTQLIIIIGFIIAFFVFPDFIGENESDLIEIVPDKHWLIFSIPIFLSLLYLQVKYKLLISGFVVKVRLVRILATVILLLFISSLISFLTLFDIYGYSNYAFAGKTVHLTGNIYKKNIQVGRNANKYYICFNDTLKLKRSVSKNEYESYSIGHMMNIKANKGRFLGYYLVKDTVITKTDDYTTK